jgi:predicted ATPase
MGGRVASPTFVGRVEELQVLEAARRRTATTEPAIVLVGGEAGVGKTRLVAELIGGCATDETRVLAGGCVPVGDGALPYAPIVEALRTLVAKVGVEEVRGLIGPSWPELARLLPALGAPDRVGQPDQAAQLRLFELVLGLLGRLGDQVPLVLVVEDLHWADRSTRDLLAFLVRNLRRERMLLVITYRNDEPGQQLLGPYLAELDRGGRVERIELSRLDRAQTVAQLVGILGAAPAAELADSVFARSEGNPSSPRSSWRSCGAAHTSCRRRFGTCSAAGWTGCPSPRPGCWRSSRWPAGKSFIGCWRGWPAWTTRH